MESWTSFQVCMLKKQEPGSLDSTIRAPDRREGQGDTAGGGGWGVPALHKPRPQEQPGNHLQRPLTAILWGLASTPGILWKAQL